MRYWIAFALLSLLVAGCGDAVPPDGAPEGMELPSAMVLGPIPPAAGRVTVEVEADGALAVDGRSCEWDELETRLLGLHPSEPVRKRKAIRAHMAAEVVEESLEETEEVEESGVIAEAPILHEERDTELPFEGPEKNPPIVGTGAGLVAPGPIAPRDPEPRTRNGESNMDVLLRIDRRVPWALAARVLMTCAHPRLEMARTFFAVEGADGRGEGSVALFLPRDARRLGSPEKPLRLRVRWRRGEAAAERLLDELRLRRSARTDRIAVSIDAEPLLPVEHLLRTVVAALRAGVDECTCEAPTPPVPSPGALCRASQAIREWHFEIPQPRARKHHPGRSVRLGRFQHYVGFENSFTWTVEEELEEVVEDGDR